MADQADNRRGPRWFVNRVREEFYEPTRTWSADAINCYLDAKIRAGELLGLKSVNPTAVYDLRICSNTFDFAYFLYDAETYFRDMGFDTFQVCILDREKRALGEYDNVIDWKKRRKRVTDMLVPMANMYGGCASVAVTESAEEIIALCRRNGPIFPKHADGRHLRTFRYKDVFEKMRQGRSFSGFHAPAAALQKVAQFKQRNGVTQPCVTLTVRSYAYQSLRNTDMDAYFKFAEFLRSGGFTPVFIPDSDAAGKGSFRDFLCFDEVSADLYLRAAMYEEAFTNVFTSNGNHTIAAFDNNSSFMIAMLNEEYKSSTGIARWTAEGLTFGDQPFGGTTKRFIWDKETFENLKDNFAIIRQHRPLIQQRAAQIEIGQAS